MMAALGTVGIGLVWGWLLVQLVSTPRPSPWGVAGMGTATGALLFLVLATLDPLAVVICAFAIVVAVAGHAAMVTHLARKSRT